MVYVLNQYGNPLMPTKRFGKVRRLLDNKQAKVIRRCPFTIQLLYSTTDYRQNITLGVDAGSKTIGLSATTDKVELYSGEVNLRQNVVKLISQRREHRRARRNRKTRYRKAKYNNRKIMKGWLSPSVKQKINTHLVVIEKVCSILPVTRIIVETASFDIQKMKDPNITSDCRAKGEQYSFWNVREYVLFRDGHICRCCNGSSKDCVLNVHHIQTR